MLPTLSYETWLWAAYCCTSVSGDSRCSSSRGFVWRESLADWDVRDTAPFVIDYVKRLV